jgi:hypothetical protein
MQKLPLCYIDDTSFAMLTIDDYGNAVRSDWNKLFTFNDDAIEYRLLLTDVNGDAIPDLI